MESGEPFGFSARHHSTDALWRARHSCDLADDDRTWLDLDRAHRGLGTASCGPDTEPRYLLTKKSYRISFSGSLRPRGG